MLMAFPLVMFASLIKRYLVVNVYDLENPPRPRHCVLSAEINVLWIPCYYDFWIKN